MRGCLYVCVQWICSRIETRITYFTNVESKTKFLSLRDVFSAQTQNRCIVFRIFHFCCFRCWLSHTCYYSATSSRSFFLYRLLHLEFLLAQQQTHHIHIYCRTRTFSLLLLLLFFRECEMCVVSRRHILQGIEQNFTCVSNLRCQKKETSKVGFVYVRCIIEAVARKKESSENIMREVERHTCFKGQAKTILSSDTKAIGVHDSQHKFEVESKPY